MSRESKNRVAVIGGSRTPFAKAGTALKDFSALELATHSVQGTLDSLKLDPTSIDQLVFGTVIVDPTVPHLAREISLQSDLPAEVRALTITDNCISGTSAIASVHDAIALGRAETGIAGGVESMSNPPVLFNKQASRIFLDAGRDKSLRGRLRTLSRLRPTDFKPWSYGIEEPSTDLTMGEHTKITVKEWNITREEQDEIALLSHVNAHRVTADGRLLSEIYPINGFDRDLLIRPEASMAALTKLPPVFDRSESGTITAGNSSPLTDGAASVVLMSEKRARELEYVPLAYIRDYMNVGIDPNDGLLMGPGVAVPRLLKQNGLTLDNIDIIEMHEAFGGQVASNLKAWKQGWKEPAIGQVDRELLNPLGRSIAIGHPFAATGARIVTTLANELERRDARYGLVSICGAGGTAVAMLLERS